MHISDSFESGAILVDDIANPRHARLKLKPDSANAAFKQWFYFRLVATAGERITVEIVDAGGVADMKSREGLGGHPVLWQNYAAFASYDGSNWFNLPTTFDGRGLAMDVRLANDAIYIATYVPYTLERQQRAVGKWLQAPDARVEVIGLTPDGRDLDLVTIGKPDPAKKKAWITARQHPGETQGSWCMEGLMERLLDPNDPVAKQLRRMATFYVIPNLNPDGSARGHTRTNMHGVNLNREWASASMEKSPEVYIALREMDRRGIDFFLDLHAWGGDKPFCIGPYHVPSVDAAGERRWRAYQTTLAQTDRAFELGQPYPGGGPTPGKADLAMSWNYVSERFGACGILYELPFKPNAATPDLPHSWSVADCHRFGRNSLEPMLGALRS